MQDKNKLLNSSGSLLFFLLITLNTVFGLQIVSFFVTFLNNFLRERPDVSLIDVGIFALVTFLLVFITGFMFYAGKKNVLLAVAVIICAARIVLQISPVSVLSLLAAAAGTIFWLASLAYLILLVQEKVVDFGPVFFTGLFLGFTVEAGLNGALGTWDLVWRDDAVSYLLLFIMAASYMAAAVRIYAGFESCCSLKPSGTGGDYDSLKNNNVGKIFIPGGRSIFYTLIVFMPFVFLQFYRFLNIAGMSAVTGFGTLLSTAVITVSNIIVFLLIYFYMAKVSAKSGRFLIEILLCIAGLILLLFSVWPAIAGTGAYIARTAAGNLASWWIMYVLLKKAAGSATVEEEPQQKKLAGKRKGTQLFWKNTCSIAISGILFFIFAFVYYGSYDMSLPLKSWMVPAAVAVLEGFCGIAAAAAGYAHYRKLRAARAGNIISPDKTASDAEESKEKAEGGIFENKRKNTAKRCCTAAYIPVFLLLAALIFPLALLFPDKNNPEINAKKDYVRIMDYNIHQGFNINGYLDLEGIARVIEGSGADIVALQEVSRGWIVNGSADTYEWLAGRLDMKYMLFTPASDDIWGNAILSKYPLKLVDSGFLPRLGAPLRRSYLLAEVDLTGAVSGSGSDGYKINILCTHVHHIEGEGDIRIKQIQSVLESWNGLERTAIMGDFNARSYEPEMEPFYEAGLRDSQAELGRGDVLTWVHYEPFERIDYIWVTDDIELLEVFVPYSTASDHLPVVLDIR